MYTQRHYTEKDQSSILAFMRQYPFAILCGVDANHAPVATQIPVLIEERNGAIFITGHIMKKTDHYDAFTTNASALVIFNGPHSYISASWYTTPQVASTWNYMTVHAKGTFRFSGDDALRDVLERTTSLFEHKGSPALMEKMPEAYIQSNMKAIAAFEIEVTDLQTTFKLSQNKDRQTRENIIKELEAAGDPHARAIAGEMLKRLDQ